jgi:hypothetical protein
MIELSGDGTNIGGALDESVAELKVLVEMLLVGWVDPRTGEHRYFKSGSREERAARYAVAYLLRNTAASLPYFSTLYRLADFFDPGRGVQALEVRFGFRREGGPGDRLKHRRIASEMRRMVRADKRVQGSVIRAVKAAMEKHGLEERQVRRIWARYGKPMLS